MGRYSKHSRANSSVSKTDLRKKANKNERKAVKKCLEEGKYDLPTYQKISQSEIQWEE